MGKEPLSIELLVQRQKAEKEANSKAIPVLSHFFNALTSSLL